MKYGSGSAGVMRGNARDGVVMMALILALPIADVVVTAGHLSRWFYYGAYATVLGLLLLFAVRIETSEQRGDLTSEW